MKRKLGLLALVLASFSLGFIFCLNLKIGKTSRAVASLVNGENFQNVWVARKKDLSVETINDGWTSVGLSQNKYFTISVEGKEIFRASTNNLEFAKDMKDLILKEVNQINDEFLIIDLSHPVWGETAHLTFAEPSERIFSASKYVEMREGELLKIKPEIGK